MPAPSRLLGLGLIGAALPAAAADLSDDYAFSPLRIGGGGWVSGVVSSPVDPDARIARTDVGGFYRWDARADAWEQLLTADRFATPGWVASAGVESVALAPTDPSVVYAAALDRVYRSADGGDTFTPTSLSVPMAGNGAFARQGERLAVSPTNPDVAFFGSRDDGLFRTTNGTDWAPVAGVASGAAGVGVTGVRFAPDGTPGAETVYASTLNQGIFRSTDGGAAWSKITGGPGALPDSAAPADLDVDAAGNLFVADRTGGSGVWRFDGSGWGNLYSAGSRAFTTVSVDPFDNQRVIAGSEGLQSFALSTDGGSSWAELSYETRSPEIPWAEVEDNSFFSTGEVYFDPSTPDRLFVGQGYGVWRADASDAALADGRVTWDFDSAGIEETVAQDIVVRPGGRPVVTFVQDLIGFVHDDPDTYSARGIEPDVFANGWDGTYRASDPDYLAHTAADFLEGRGALNRAGFSADGGDTWQRFGSIESGTHPTELKYGTIAAGNDGSGAGGGAFEDNLVWVPPTDGRPFYSLDGGDSWSAATVWPTDTEGGPGVDADTGFFNRNFLYQGLVADPVTPGAYYLTTAYEGLLKSVDGGVSWARISDDFPNFGFAAQLVVDPTDPQTLWYAHGRLVGEENLPNRRGLSLSRDGGMSFTALADTTYAIDVALGAAAPGSDLLTLYFLGELNGEEGVYRSLDDGQNWDFLARYADGLLDQPIVLEADPDVFGRIYLGYGGTGFLVGDFADPIPEPAAGGVALAGLFLLGRRRRAAG